MTVKLDIPALANRIDPRLEFLPEQMDERERLGLPRVPVMSLPILSADLIAASDALRSLTTALEIGRAMGMSQAAEMHDKWAEGCDEGLAHCLEVFHTPGQWYEQKSYHQDSAKYIREAAGAVDLEGLTERIAQILAETEDSLPVTMATYRYQATVVLSSLGLHAREN